MASENFNTELNVKCASGAILMVMEKNAHADSNQVAAGETGSKDRFAQVGY